jgi:hypothetical protein
MTHQLGFLHTFEQYENWKKTRNAARAHLEAKYGYDTKHGMHLLRLMRMCVEIPETGKVLVKRPDREELLQIRAGAWSYDRLIEEAEALEQKCDKLYLVSEALSRECDRNFLDELVVDMSLRYHAKHAG